MYTCTYLSRAKTFQGFFLHFWCQCINWCVCSSQICYCEIWKPGHCLHNSFNYFSCDNSFDKNETAYLCSFPACMDWSFKLVEREYQEDTSKDSNMFRNRTRCRVNYLRDLKISRSTCSFEDIRPIDSVADESYPTSRRLSQSGEMK